MKKKRKKKEFKLDPYIFGALRKIWRWHPSRKEALDRALVDYATEYKFKPYKGSLKKRKQTIPIYGCEKCALLWPKSKIHVDHIEPVIDPKKGFVDWNTYIEKLYVKAKDLQVLCKKCHKEKTNKENTVRRKKRKEKKNV